MPTLSARLHRRIERDFPEPGAATEVVSLVAAGADTERVQAAIVICGRGELVRVRSAQELALADWRDVLVSADLADDDWPDKLNAQLGTEAD